MSRMTRWMTMMISLRLMMLRRTDPKNRDSRFVKAFAVAMLMRISQEPPCDEFSGLARSAHTLREPAQSKCSWTFDKTHSLYVRILRKGLKLGTQTLHDPAQSKLLHLDT